MKRWKCFVLFIGSILIVDCDSPSSSDHEDLDSRERLPRLDSSHYSMVEYEVTLNNGTHDICGGTILSSKYILTVAHCVYTEQGPIKGPIYLVLGLTRYTIKVMRTRALAKRIFVPTIFHGDKGPWQEGDIAVVELDRKVRSTQYEIMRSVELPRPIKTNDDGSHEYRSYEGKPSMLFAYEELEVIYPLLVQHPELLDQEMLMSRTIFVSEAEVLRQPACVLAWQSDVSLGRGHLCAKMFDVTFPGVCTGEPGTGLIHGFNTIIGVASFGGESCKSAAGRPGVFTRVSSYMWFINAVLDNDANVKGICDYPVVNIILKKNRGVVAAANCAWVVGLSVVLLGLG